MARSTTGGAKAAAKKAPAVTRTPKKSPAKKASAAKAPAKKSPAKKAAPAKKASAKKSPAKKAAPARKAPAKKSPTKKTAAAKKAPATSSPAKKAPAKKAAKKVSFPAKWLSEQEQVLLSERSTYLHQAESLKAEADSLVADFEPGDVQFDEESGEGDSLNIERERDLALSAQARQAIDEIDRALAKIAAGTYGICEVSGEPIPRERLEAIPWARERVEYKSAGLGRR